jgi:predicted DNA-binding ribbon-helix-helix protein
MSTKYSVSIGERITDVSMEEEFWNALRDIAADRNTMLSTLLKEIFTKSDSNLDRRRIASVLRTYVLEHYMRGIPIEARSETRFASGKAYLVQ